MGTDAPSLRLTCESADAHWNAIAPLFLARLLTGEEPSSRSCGLRLLRTSAVLADVDGLLAAVPPSLADMEPTLTRINRVLRSLALQ